MSVHRPPTNFEWPILDVIRAHRFETHRRGNDRPEDPGWHPCRCGWEGYWSDFEPHVATHVAEAVLAPGRRGKTRQALLEIMEYRGILVRTARGLLVK